MGHLGTVGTATQNTSASTVSITLTAAVPAGATILVGIVWDSPTPGAVPAIASVTDTGGNAYTTTPDASINAGTTVSCAILRGRVTTPLAAGGTITVTISGGTRGRWAMQADAFDDVIASSPLDKIATNAPASNTVLSSGVTAATAQASELAIAIFGFGGGRTVTDLGGWSGGAKVETTAGSTDRGMQVIHRYVSATGPQEGTITLSTASTYVGAISTYRASAPPAPTGSAAGWGFIPI